MRRLVASLALLAAVPVVGAQTLEQAATLRDQQRVSLGTPSAPASRFSLAKAFSPEHFRMSHSVEFESGAMGGGLGYSVGTYTNTMQWQFDQKLAARLDLAVATSPTGLVPSGFGVARSEGVRAYVRNAEIAYRPTRSTELRLQFQQNPYGNAYYGTPYGYQQSGYVPASQSNRFRVTYGGGDDLFWRNR